MDKKVKILVIDDIKDNIITLKALIAESFPKAEVLTAGNAKEGLNIAENQDPDMILLDIVMPEMDGYQACRKLKSNKNLSDIPVVFITALRDETDSRIKALEAGADAFLSKPVDKSELIAQIRAMIKIRKLNIEKRAEKENLKTEVENKTSELQKTHKATLNLLDDLKKENEKRKETENALRESEKHFEFLTRTAFELLELKSLKEIYKFTARELYELLDDDVFVSIVEYDWNTKRWHMQHLEGVSNMIDKASKLMGADIRKLEGEISTKYFEKISFGRLKEIEFDFPGLFNNRFSDLIGKAVKKILSIDRIYTITLKQKDDVLGNLTFTTTKNTKAVNTELIEAFVLQATNFIKKQQSEKALIESEEKYRMLFNTNEDSISVFYIDKNGKTSNFVEFNDAATKLCGYTREELLNLSIIELEQETPREIVDERTKKLLNNTSINFETIIRNKAGEKRNITVNTHLINYKNRTAVMNISRDITERKIAEGELKKRESLMNKIFDLLPIGLWVADEKGNLLRGNLAGIKIWGAEPKVSIDKYGVFNARRLPSGELIKAEDWALAKTIRNKETIKDELLEIEAFDGAKKIILNYTAPVLNDKNELIGAIVVNNDITELKKAENKIIESEIKYRKLVEQMQEGLLLVDNDDIIKYANPSFCKMLGYDENELIGKVGYHILINENDRESIIKRNSDREDGISEAYELNMIKKNSEQIVMLMHATPVRNNEEVVIGSMSTCIDITSRKKSSLIQNIQLQIAHSILKVSNLEELMQIVQKELSKVIDTNNFLFATYNPDSDMLKKVLYDDEKDDFTEWPSSASLSGQVVKTGKSLLLNKDDINALAKTKNLNLIGSLAECWLGVPVSIENKAFGAMVVQSYTDAQAYNDDDKKLLEMIAHQIGIYLERRNILADLVNAKEKAEESDKLKTAFINNISHEIRTPLNGIIGFGQMIINPELTPNQRLDYYDVIQRSSERLINTVSDLMDISMISSGSLLSHKSNFRLKPVLSELFDKTVDLCSGKNVVVKLSVPDNDNDIILYSDKELVKKVLWQLLTNAAKFTGEGRIVLGYSLNDEEMEFFVKDTGKGISSDKINDIYTPFWQEDVENTRGHEGSGLGLSIAKGMVDLLGGQLQVESVKDKGSEFKLFLPYTPGMQITKSKDYPKPEGSECAHILIAEDDEINYFFLKTVLGKSGYNTLHALNGLQAVEMCEKYPEICLVIMDIKMPVMNGLEATSKIKEIRPQLPVIAVTAHAQTGDEQRIINAGCNAYLAKPVTKDRLMRAVNEFLQPKGDW